MRYIVAVILFIVWLCGLAGIYSIGWFVHVLLVGALALVYLELLSGRRVTSQRAAPR
jgi:Family of unknown function (DUF5670)